MAAAISSRWLLSTVPRPLIFVRYPGSKISAQVSVARAEAAGQLAEFKQGHIGSASRLCGAGGWVPAGGTEVSRRR